MSSASFGYAGVSYRLWRLELYRHISWNRRAAVSGNGNVGIPASCRILWPAAIWLPPIQLASTGLPVSLAYGFKRSAISVGLVIPCGLRMIRNPSELGSLAAISMAAA